MALEQEAPGWVKGDGNGNFSSEFTLPNGVRKQFNGKISSAVPEFVATLSKVSYDKEGSLSGDYNFDKALVGAATISLPLQDGVGQVHITGNLNPYLTKAYTATGSGTWSST
jgi:hypothetical protein